MTRKELRNKGVDIVVHPVLIGIEEDEQKKCYSFTIFDNEEELISLGDSPDFETYEEAEEKAVERAVTWVKTLEN